MSSIEIMTLDLDQEVEVEIMTSSGQVRREDLQRESFHQESFTLLSTRGEIGMIETIAVFIAVLKRVTEVLQRSQKQRIDPILEQSKLPFLLRTSLSI